MYVRYKDDKKELDFNAEAEGFVRLYADNLAQAEDITPDGEPGDAALLEDGTEYEALPGEADGLYDDGPIGAEEGPQEEEVLTGAKLEAVEAECERLREDTRAECDAIIAETRASLEQETTAAYAEAERKGYSDGQAKAEGEYAALKQELQEKLVGLDAEFEKKVDELEPQFVELVIELIEKITGILVDDRRDLILHIIRQSILGMDNSNSYIIHVSKDDFDFVNSKKQELTYELKGNVVEVVEDPVLSRAQCTIETDTRIFDCSLDVQLKNLIADLRLLSGQ